MLAGCLSPFCAVNQVLGYFRDRFIREADTSAIVFELESKGIIPNGVLTAVNEKRDATIQNQILYAHLEKTSTKYSLITVCGVIIAVPGNPKMRALGEDMKASCRVSCVCHPYMRAHLHVCMCDMTCLVDPNHTHHHCPVPQLQTAPSRLQGFGVRFKWNLVSLVNQSIQCN